MELWQEILVTICVAGIAGAVGGATAIAMAARSEIRRKIKRDQSIMRIMGISDAASTKDEDK